MTIVERTDSEPPPRGGECALRFDARKGAKVGWRAVVLLAAVVQGSSKANSQQASERDDAAVPEIAVAHQAEIGSLATSATGDVEIGSLATSATGDVEVGSLATSATEGAPAVPEFAFTHQRDSGSPTSDAGAGVLAREGFATLTWQRVPAAAGYRLSDERGVVLYEGRQPRAFVSGLVEGEHRFEVAAVDAEGRVVARGDSPAVVRVRHWSTWLSGGLLVTGAVVVSVLIGLLVAGEHRDRRDGRDLRKASDGQ